MECIILFYTILQYKNVKFQTQSFVYVDIIIVIINIDKCHCCHDLCSHFGLNRVANYGEYFCGNV